MKFTFIFLFLFGVALVELAEGKSPDAPAAPALPQNDDEEDDEEADNEEDEGEDEDEGESEEEDDDEEDEYELDEGAQEDYYEDETTTQPPTTTTTQTTTTTKPTTPTTTTTTTTKKSTTTSTTTKPTTTSTTSTTTTTVDPRKALEPKVMSLLNSFSALQTAVSSTTVQDQTCKDKISSSLVAFLAAGLKLEESILKEPYSKGLSSVTGLEANLKEITEEWAECQARTTTTTTTKSTTTTTESTTTTTECPTTTEAPTTITEEKRLKESIPEFTIDPPKQEYAREPNSAQDEEINKQLMEEIKRTEDMIEKQKHAIIHPIVIQPAIEEPEEEPEPTIEETTTTEATTTTVVATTTTKPPVTPRIAPKPPVTHTKRVVPVTAAAATTTVHPHKHIMQNHGRKFKTLKSTKDKAPAICNDSMDLFSGPRYAKSVCVIYKNMTYSAAHDLCIKEEMDLFAIQTVDHHLVCRLKMHELFEKVPSYWINGRYINDLWYYFSSENAGQKRFIYPGTQFNGPHNGNCLRLMKFEDHNTVAASAANCELELPVFCEYYIQ